MPVKTFYITKEELENLYINQNMRRIDVANYFGCSDALIVQYIRKYKLQKPKFLENKNKEREDILLQCKNPNCPIKYFNVRPFRAKKAKFCSNACWDVVQYKGIENKRQKGAIRRARIYNATPILSEDEQKRINEIYKNRPIGYEVDHIIPLCKGGLHHPDNLQYLTITENRRKGSKIINV